MRRFRHCSALALVVVALACGAAPAAKPAASTVATARQVVYPPAREPLEGAGVAVPAPKPVASHHGVRVQLPGLGIDLPIIEGDGQEPPLNVAAHYPGMKWPGEGDRSFLYAHARPGMFGPLFAPAIGQKVLIVEPDGGIFRYTIRSYTASWPVYDMSITHSIGREELVLYTCTSWTYSDPKIVAIALPDPS